MYFTNLNIYFISKHLILFSLYHYYHSCYFLNITAHFLFAHVKLRSQRMSLWVNVAAVYLHMTIKLDTLILAV